MGAWWSSGVTMKFNILQIFQYISLLKATILAASFYMKVLKSQFPIKHLWKFLEKFQEETEISLGNSLEISLEIWNRNFSWKFFGWKWECDAHPQAHCAICRGGLKTFIISLSADPWKMAYWYQKGGLYGIPLMKCIHSSQIETYL